MNDHLPKQELVSNLSAFDQTEIQWRLQPPAEKDQTSERALGMSS